MRPAPAQRGFTMPELIAVILIISVLAVAALPRLDAALLLRTDTYRDQVISALRLAQHTAVSHRRLVCAQIASQSVTLQIAPAQPAATCSTALVGSVGGAHAVSQGTTSTPSPTGTLYFQPSGRITSDGAGVTAGLWSVAISGGTAITVTGETGHVD